ncbi:MAG: YicC/YloC family endoribonuclease [Halioglobus sp.]
MTAFARETIDTDQGTVTVELRSVNHRYLDLSFKIPDSMRQIELKLREKATKDLARGKLDCLIRVQARPQQASAISLNQEQLSALLKASAIVAEQLPEARPISPLEILQFPGIIGGGNSQEEDLLSAAGSLFSTALSSMVDNRQREGEKLKQMVLDRLEQVAIEVTATRAILPDLMSAQREKILARINDLDIEVDSNRLEQELVHQAQKADIDEELDRLEAHIDEVRRTLGKGGPCGRRLDFLMQELNREANTLSSKSVSTSTTQNAVTLKVLIEQMREQIQNIE